MPVSLSSAYILIIMTWKPHVTVAAIIEQNQRFLIIEEQTPYGIQLNQPAGHLESGESLIEAVKREVQEESAWQFEPSALIGIQLWRRNSTSPTFLRCCFTGEAHSHNPEQQLDTGILAVHWLSVTELEAQQARLRSPLVLTSVYDYLQGKRYPLSLLTSLLNHA